MIREIELEQMMMTVAKLLGFEPSKAEIKAAKSELYAVPSDIIEYVMCAATNECRSLSPEDVEQFARNLNMLMLSAINYRVKMRVSEYRIYGDKQYYFVCPRCRRTLDRSFQSYCDRCGQHLKWVGLKHLRIASLK